MDNSRELQVLAEQMNIISDLVVGYREASFDDICEAINRMKTSEVLLNTRDNARNQAAAIRDACENLLAEIESLSEF